MSSSKLTIVLCSPSHFSGLEDKTVLFLVWPGGQGPLRWACGFFCPKQLSRECFLSARCLPVPSRQGVPPSRADIQPCSDQALWPSALTLSPSPRRSFPWRLLLPKATPPNSSAPNETHPSPRLSFPLDGVGPRCLTQWGAPRWSPVSNTDSVFMVDDRGHGDTS